MPQMTPEPQAAVPGLRSDLVICPVGADGQFVIKNAAEGRYFQVGEQEHYLFSQLDNAQSYAKVCEAFEQRFAEPLSVNDLREFVDLAHRRGLLQVESASSIVETAAPKHPARLAVISTSPRKQSWLHYRVPFFDPDGLLNRMEPRLRFIWSRPFFVFTLGLLAVAAAVTLLNGAQFISSFPDVINWQTVALVWMIVFVATLMHEFAHGLTCKHFGGEVHEIGFLMLFFMPCLYCNVSDAWLFRENWKRIWVGLAGTYCDLVVWAVATLVWRVTLPETTLNYFAWILATVCGGRCCFNFNPLIKLDGYYLLSDAAQIPNLSDRGRSRWMATLRWLLWGGRRPAPEPRSGFLLCYGVASWLFLVTLLVGFVVGLVRMQNQASQQVTYLGTGVSLFMIFIVGKNTARGIFDREFKRMFTKRKMRVVAWCVALIGIPTLLMLIPVRDRTSGTFAVRPATRIEVNSREAGFLRDIHLAEGSVVKPGTPLARIEIPDLASNLRKKQAEIREAEANLKRLQAGPRPEEVAEQRLRVDRATEWVELGKSELLRAQQSLEEELLQLEQEILQYDAEVEYSRLSLAHAEKLHAQAAMTGEQLQSEKTKAKVLELKLAHGRARKRSREAEGTMVAETELARRLKGLADEESRLKLLEAGGRPEEVEAERARLARLTEEHDYLKLVESRVVLCSPVAGVITTPRMNEKNGQYVATGTVVCVVEELTDLMVEISISEFDVLGVHPGQSVQLRARAMPMRSFHATVERVAPSATVAVGHTQGTVTAYCRLSQADTALLSGMTGYARIYRDDQPLGKLLFKRLMNYVRTEFWWW